MGSPGAGIFYISREQGSAQLVCISAALNVGESKAAAFKNKAAVPAPVGYRKERKAEVLK